RPTPQSPACTPPTICGGYLIDAGTLYEVKEDWTSNALATGLATDAMRFAEVNGIVFCTNGTDYLTIYPDGEVRRWGIRPPAMPSSLVAGTGILPAGLYQVCCTLS